MKNSAQNTNSVILSPNPRLSIFIIAIGVILILIPINYLFGVVIGCFGLFLLIQTFTLRLEFEQEAMVVLQLSREIRRFPYKKWLAWRMLFPALPGILYFREEASPHLLPILFDKNELQKQLRLRVGNLEKPKKSLNPTS